MVGPNSPEASRVEEVFQTLLRRMLNGTWLAGARIPSERDLAGELGVARVTLREAVRRLVDARIVLTRPGSGAVVRPRQEWTLRALPVHLLERIEAGDWPGLSRLVVDAMEMRRSLVLDFIERAGARLEGKDLSAIRQRIREAWEQRGEMAAFLERDWAVLPTILEEAGMIPSLWLVNTLADTYLGTMQVPLAQAQVPPTYLEIHLEVCDHLEAGDGLRARELIDTYLEQLDQHIYAALPEPIRVAPER